MTTAEDLQAKLMNEYENGDSAESLFYKSNCKNPCFRLEVGNIGWQCTYGDLDQGVVGYSLQGTLYYHNGEFSVIHPKIPEDKITSACFSVEQVQNKAKTLWYAHIKFYEPCSTNLLGEFLGEDPDHVVCGSGLNNNTETGKWKKLYPNDLEDHLNDSYEYKDGAAEVLFFETIYGSPSLRIEIPSQGWEFSYGRWVGPDPMGTFYYNGGVFGGDNPELQRGKGNDAYFYMKQILNKKGVTYVHIRFFAPGSKSQLLGEFLGEDRSTEFYLSGLLQRLIQGTWKEGCSATANGTIASKDKHSNTITITCGPENKKATITCKTTDQIHNEAIHCHGRLTARDFKDISKAKLVRWYHDLVVFYEDNNSTDWSAFYFPSPDSGNDPLGTDTTEKDWSGVNWEDI